MIKDRNDYIYMYIYIRQMFPTQRYKIRASIHQAVRRLTAESCEVSKPRDWVYNNRIALKFDRYFGSAAAEVPVKFQSNWKSLNPNLAASRLHEILR